MKNLVTLLALSFMAQVGVAQLASVDNSPTTFINYKIAPEDSNVAKSGNSNLINELSAAFKNAFVTPEVVKEFGLAGKSLVNVHIDENGMISKVVIIKSVDKSIDKAIIKALKKVDKIAPVNMNSAFQSQIVQLPVIIE